MANEFKAKNGLITPVVTSTVTTGVAPLVVSSTTPVANLSIGGNAGTATQLATARTINGILFDGTSNISIGVIGKNYLHNSNFAINQLGLTGTVTLAANSKDAHDRFKAGASGCTYTFATVSGKTTLTITAGTLIQTVNALDLPSGTNTMCLSFGGTSTGKIGVGSAGASGVTGSVVGGANLDITFSTGTLWEVKLEKGSVPTAYEQPNAAQEWANCLLYFEKLGAVGGLNFDGTGRGTTYENYIFFSRKITTPTVTATGLAYAVTDYNTYILLSGWQTTQDISRTAATLIWAVTSIGNGTRYRSMLSGATIIIDARL